MRKATTVKPIMWRKPGFRQFSANARYVFVYLLTNPSSNLAGLFQCSLDTICFDTGLVKASAKKAMAELTDAGKVMFDDKQGIVFITNWLRHNPIHNERLEVGYMAQIKTFEFHHFHELAVSCLSGDFPDSVSDTLSDTLPDRVSHTLMGQGSLNSRRKVSPKKQSTEVLEYWNSKYNRDISAWEKVRDRINQGATIDDCKLVIDFWTKKWTGTKYQDYIRPATLFAPTRFKEYLSEAKEGDAKPKYEEF